MKKTLRFLFLPMVAFSIAGSLRAASLNGSAGDMPAYYDHKLFTINFKEMPEDAAQAIREHNRSLNLIFMSEDPLPDGSEFVAVIDAIQGDGFNPLWLELEIEFTPGHAPRQLFSDDEIEAALNAGEITLEVTDEVYRCSVVGPGPKGEQE
jgi:hypothetical protein